MTLRSEERLREPATGRIGLEATICVRLHRSALQNMLRIDCIGNSGRLRARCN